MATPEGWRTVRIGDAARLAVPPDAAAHQIQPIDSIVGVYSGDGYEVVYDYGRSAEDLGLYREEPGYAAHAREVDGRPGTEISFRGRKAPWDVIRLVQVGDGQDVLTVRVSAVDEAPGTLADTVFDTVRFGAT